MKKRLVVISIVVVSLLAIGAGSATAKPRRLKTSAILTCVVDGGTILDLEMRNNGPTAVRIDPDVRVTIEIVRSGRQPGMMLFVFPAPTHARVPAGETRSYRLKLGTADETSPGIDLSGERLLLEIEISVAGRTAPIVRTFTFDGC